MRQRCLTASLALAASHKGKDLRTARRLRLSPRPGRHPLLRRAGHLLQPHSVKTPSTMRHHFHTGGLGSADSIVVLMTYGVGGRQFSNENTISSLCWDPECAYNDFLGCWVTSSSYLPRKSHAKNQRVWRSVSLGDAVNRKSSELLQNALHSCHEAETFPNESRGHWARNRHFGCRVQGSRHPCRLERHPVALLKHAEPCIISIIGSTLLLRMPLFFAFS